MLMNCLNFMYVIQITHKNFWVRTPLSFNVCSFLLMLSPRMVSVLSSKSFLDRKIYIFFLLKPYVKIFFPTQMVKELVLTCVISNLSFCIFSQYEVSSGEGWSPRTKHGTWNKDLAGKSHRVGETVSEGFFFSHSVTDLLSSIEWKISISSIQ